VEDGLVEEEDIVQGSARQRDGRWMASNPGANTSSILRQRRVAPTGRGESGRCQRSGSCASFHAIKRLRIDGGILDDREYPDTDVCHKCHALTVGEQNETGLFNRDRRCCRGTYEMSAQNNCRVSEPGQERRDQHLQGRLGIPQSEGARRG
jgi:hypothetical protein